MSTTNYIRNIITGELVFFEHWGEMTEVKYPGEWAVWKPFLGMPPSLRVIGVPVKVPNLYEMKDPRPVHPISPPLPPPGPEPVHEIFPPTRKEPE